MKIIFRSIIFILFIFAAFLTITTESNISKTQENELINAIVPIRSIQPSDTNFSDLHFLETVLKDNKILLLGEALHSDGTTFLAKTRLIKYLHEQLDYDVILWEAGLFNVWYMNEEFSQENQFDPSLAMYYFWYKTLETDELWKYFNQQQQTDTLQLGGFDLQHSGAINDSVLGDKIISFLQSKNVNPANFPHFNSIIYKFNHGVKKASKRQEDFTPNDSITSDFNNIVEIIKPQLHHFEDSLFFRYLTQMLSWTNYTWNYEIGDPRRFHFRDSIMADNLLWLVNQYYPDKKVIIWAANMHILYNNALYQQKTDEMNFVSMGEYIKNEFGDQAYAMIFSSYCRLSKRNTIYEKGGNKSIEYQLYKHKIRYGFLNFRAIPEDSFLHDDIILRANQNYEIKGKWSDMADGLFYINTMQIIHYKE
jgi:erythromycin esterase-like protein